MVCLCALNLPILAEKMRQHIDYDAAAQELRLLDQRLLPQREELFVCRSAGDVVFAIREMVVRGAPAIGVAAALGCALAAREWAGAPDWPQRLLDDFRAIEGARPTAVNLSWAVGRMRSLLQRRRTVVSGPEMAALLETEAMRIRADDESICRRIGAIGQQVVHDGDTVLTHCNAGALATAGYGTALGVIRAARDAGKRVSVIADETRPLLQGARLTAYELARDGIDVRVACDNACALLMQKGLVSLVIAGADRIAANGDCANKIGTLGVAILAASFGLPFYIAAPLSTIDAGLDAGHQIPIEERAPDEVSRIGETRLCPAGVPVFNYAFDVTPASLITGIITEAGILRPPYGAAIAAALDGSPHHQLEMAP